MFICFSYLFVFVWICLIVLDIQFVNPNIKANQAFFGYQTFHSGEMADADAGKAFET